MKYADTAKDLKDCSLSGKGYFSSMFNEIFNIMEPVIWVEERVWCNGNLLFISKQIICSILTLFNLIISFVVIPKPDSLKSRISEKFSGKLVFGGVFDQDEYKSLKEYCKSSSKKGTCDLDERRGTFKGRDGMAHLMIIRFSEAMKSDIIHKLAKNAEKVASINAEKAASKKAALESVIKDAIKAAENAENAAKNAVEAVQKAA